MDAFEFVMTLYSFVYALGVAQLLAAVGDMVRASDRIRFSWLHAGWMLNVMLAIVAWWLSLWDLQSLASWPMTTVIVFFVVACVLYLLSRLVSPTIAQDGPADMRTFHRQEGRKYAALFTVNTGLTIATVYLYGTASENWIASNSASWPTLAASLAATLTNNRWVQVTAILTIIAIWVWYFATLQSALV